MDRQDALRYLLFDTDQIDRASTKYGKTPLMRSIVAWNVSLRLCDNDESQVTSDLLSDVIRSINIGENVVEMYVNGEYGGG